MIQSISSNGKIILAGEYLVLKGADAFVYPVKDYQTTTCYFSKENNNTIITQSFDHQNKQFFNCNVHLKKSNKTNIIANSIKENFYESLVIYLERITESKINISKIINHFRFNPKLGLGSSSTSIYNLSKIYNQNPYHVYNKFNEGSGADIASCSQNQEFIYFRDPNNLAMNITPVRLSKFIYDHSLFIYLDQKQNTQKEVNRFNELNFKNNLKEEIELMNALTKEIYLATNMDQIKKIFLTSETLISSLIKIEPVQNILFKDFFGQVKSLGAWGGDLIWAISEESMEDQKQYFTNKGFSTHFTFQDL